MSFRKKDPTTTVTLRNRAVSKINSKFNKIKKVIRETIVDNQVLTNEVTPDNKIKYVALRDPEKLDEFMKWLNLQISKEILSGTASDNWLNVFIGNAYTRGVKKTRSAIGRKYVELGYLKDTSVFANPAHVDRAELIYTRVYSQLKGVTEAMEQQISRILADGIIQGLNPTVIAKNLNDRVDKIGKVRARLIARTEIVSAHNVATLQEAEILEKTIGQPIKVVWQTALDGRERDTHRARNRKVYTQKEALPLLGEPNCRCSVTPWLEDLGEV